MITAIAAVVASLAGAGSPGGEPAHVRVPIELPEAEIGDTAEVEDGRAAPEIRLPRG